MDVIAQPNALSTGAEDRKGIDAHMAADPDFLRIDDSNVAVDQHIRAEGRETELGNFVRCQEKGHSNRVTCSRLHGSGGTVSCRQRPAYASGLGQCRVDALRDNVDVFSRNPRSRGQRHQSLRQSVRDG